MEGRPVKYRVRSNGCELPQLVEQLVQRELSAYDERHGRAVRSGEVRFYAFGEAATEPMKCCLIEVSLRQRGTLCVTNIDRRWIEVVRQAFRNLTRATLTSSLKPVRNERRA
jgi:hypothetical protein